MKSAKASGTVQECITVWMEILTCLGINFSLSRTVGFQEGSVPFSKGPEINLAPSTYIHAVLLRMVICQDVGQHNGTTPSAQALTEIVTYCQIHCVFLHSQFSGMSIRCSPGML